MKGLLIKDIKLMLKQKNFFLMLIVIAVLMAYAVENASYIIGYLSVVGSLFTLSSISYDEFDNGNAFLFSLPITRKAYVVEKYGFGLILEAASGCWLPFSRFLLSSGNVRLYLLKPCPHRSAPCLLFS